jgi:hypothetical protein
MHQVQRKTAVYHISYLMTLHHLQAPLKENESITEEHMLRSKDSFTEADDPRGHLKKMLSGSMLNG